MLRLLKFLFTGDAHLHKWKTIKTGKITQNGGAVRNYYDCRCRICGKYKSFTI